MTEQKTIYHNTYWNHRGKYPELLEKLNKLIPDEGEVKNQDDNPALEDFRAAQNCYYDLYNNGLCNREDEFREIFGFDGSGELTRPTVAGAERIMNKLILAAAKEQGLKPGRD